MRKIDISTIRVYSMRYFLKNTLKILIFSTFIPQILYAGTHNNIANTVSNDTTMLKVKDINVYPAKKGNNTLRLKVSNVSSEQLIFAVHIQSNMKINSLVGRGWGTVFYDTLLSDTNQIIEHSFPFYSDLFEGINMRIRFYQLRKKDEWKFENYFYSKTYNSTEIADLLAMAPPSIPAPKVNIIDEFKNIQKLLKEEKYRNVWQRFSKSYQEAMYQGDFGSFRSKINKKQPFDHWNVSQLLNLLPQEYIQLDDNQMLLNLILDNTKWKIYFKYQDNLWQINWIEGYTTLVDLWMTWEERLYNQLQIKSTSHFDFYFYKGSYAEQSIEEISNIREQGYIKISKYLELETNQRIIVVFFNDFETKAIETGHTGKGAAFDTTIIEVYNEQVQANPYHETVHILSSFYGTPPAIFSEGLAEYMEIVLSGNDFDSLNEDLKGKITKLRKSSDWIPIKKLMTFTDIPGPSQAHVSYPEAAAYVKFLIEKYGKQKFFEVFTNLTNSDKESVHTENIKKLETIYGKAIDIIIEEFLREYL
jgi:hypothetical protein